MREAKVQDRRLMYRYRIYASSIHLYCCPSSDDNYRSQNFHLKLEQTLGMAGTRNTSRGIRMYACLPSTLWLKRHPLTINHRRIDIRILWDDGCDDMILENLGNVQHSSPGLTVSRRSWSWVINYCCTYLLKQTAVCLLFGL